MTSVLVSHPHVAAVSAGLAACLRRTASWPPTTRVAASPATVCRGGSRGAGPRRPSSAIESSPAFPRPPPRERGPGARRSIAARLAGGSDPLRLYNALFTTHDLAVSLAAGPAETTAIYAYEDGALRTFRRAARAGLERIWDLPLPHYLTIEEILRAEFHRWPGAALGPPHREPDWKRRRKDAELALATKISVASAFTKKSLERLDLVRADRGRALRISNRELRAAAAPPAGPSSVLSVGTHDLRKGTPYLLEAWKRAGLQDAELHIVGPLRLAKSFLDRLRGPRSITGPTSPNRELGRTTPRRSAGIFPTLGDGFGLVIQEAMCSGTPVRDDALRRRTGMHHRRCRRLDRPAARHRRPGRAAAGLRRRPRPHPRRRSRRPGPGRALDLAGGRPALVRALEY